MGVDVRFGSLADILQCNPYVRFTPESGHTVMRLKGLLSAKSGLVQRSKKDSYLMI